MEGDVLDALEQLGYGGPLLDETCIAAAVAAGLSSPGYVELCVWLTSRLQTLCKLEESISSGPVFLSSELQAAQVARSRALSSEEEEEKKEEEEGGGGRSSASLQDLQLICRTLDLPEPRGRDVEEVFSQVEEQMNKVLRNLPAGHVGEPVLTRTLSPDQWVMVDTMASAYQPRRHALRPLPSVGVAELLAARQDLCLLVLMGRVPDRGGRPSEIDAPPPEMPPWQKRQEGGEEEEEEVAGEEGEEVEVEEVAGEEEEEEVAGEEVEEEEAAAAAAEEEAGTM
ncbi:hypothetical protein CRUP_010102, partial [Coryphaenoides rupestris]